VQQLKQASDKELVGRIVDDNDQQAFTQLVERYQRPVFGILYKVLGNSREVEDTAQEVFLALYRSLETFKGDAKFSTWLYRVAYNHGCSAMRRLKSKKRSMLDQSLERADGSTIEFPDPNVDQPEQKLLAKQVWDVVATMPEQSRVVIELFYGQERTYAEIADILELPMGTVKTHLFRAREELRKQVMGSPTDNES